jgi:PAS domain S-box-containing protein
MVGRDEVSLQGRSLRDVTHPDDFETDAGLLSRLQSGEMQSYERDKRYLRPDGSEVWGRATVSVVRDGRGVARLFLAQIQDLSERQAAETALVAIEARYRLIAETTTDIIVMTDLQGVVTYVSPSVRRIGATPRQIVGQKLDAFVSPRAAQAIARMRAALLAGEPTEGLRARVLHGGTGEPIWLETRMTLLRDPDTGAPSSFLDVIREVGRQVAQEEALAAARREAEDAAAAKTQFLANMSHEIRTPLTAVLGFAELLAKRPSLDERARAYVDRITGAGNALLAIVNDILDFSKLEAGKFVVRPRATDVASLCEETLHLFHAQAEAKGLSLVLEEDPRLPHAVRLDSDRLRQLFINLVGNAVKFTEHGGVAVRLLSVDEGQGLRLEVEDTGPGLDDEQLAHLFQRFSQVDGATSRRHGGTGLGLAICKGVAEAMGGEIGVESEPGKRTLFHVNLPAPEVEIPLLADPEADIPSIQGVRVLVVDDNAANRELAARILEAQEAVPVEASGGAEALELLARERFDVVLLDLRMPGVDGRQVLERLRAQPGPNRAAPVVAFTADMDVADGLADFTGVVRKPISANVMAAAVAAAIADHGPEPAARGAAALEPAAQAISDRPVTRM